MLRSTIHRASVEIGWSDRRRINRTTSSAVATPPWRWNPLDMVASCRSSTRSAQTARQLRTVGAVSCSSSVGCMRNLQGCASFPRARWIGNRSLEICSLIPKVDAICPRTRRSLYRRRHRAIGVLGDHRCMQEDVVEAKAVLATWSSAWGATACQLEFGQDHWMADIGEADRGHATPHEILDAALASCTALSLQLYVKHKGWRVSRVGVAVAHKHTQGAYRLERRISVEG